MTICFTGLVWLSGRYILKESLMNPRLTCQSDIVSSYGILDFLFNNNNNNNNNKNSSNSSSSSSI